MSSRCRHRQFSILCIWKFLLGTILLLAGICPLMAADTGQPYFFQRSWTTAQKAGGLPNNTVTAVVQTHDGYLWFGTYNGLARFDWPQFKVFKSANEPELQSDRITALYEDSSGTLWIGDERGGVTSYQEGKFQAQNVHETGPRRKVSAIAADASGDVWILNESGTLVRIRDGATNSLPNTDGVALLAQDGQGRLWVASGGQLAAVDNGRLTRLTNTNNSNGVGYYVLGICASRDGGLWIVSDGQIRKWRNHGIVENRGPSPYNAAVVSMLETKSGTLAMGTSSDGLYLMFSNNAVQHFNHAIRRSCQ